MNYRVYIDFIRSVVVVVVVFFLGGGWHRERVMISDGERDN